jgi:hypothetical protein
MVCVEVTDTMHGVCGHWPFGATCCLQFWCDGITSRQPLYWRDFIGVLMVVTVKVVSYNDVSDSDHARICDCLGVSFSLWSTCNSFLSIFSCSLRIHMNNISLHFAHVLVPCVRACACVCARARVYIYVCVCICVCVCIYVCVCVCVSIYTYVCVCIYICLCVYLYIHVCVYIYIYIYIQ